MDDLEPPERERVRRRDRKRRTEMVVNGGNLRRQMQALAERARRRRPAPSAQTAEDSTPKRRA
ncbi:MAG: hypothetical protein ACYDEA_10325 [Candidatus Dormibacteria bacterium]